MTRLERLVEVADLAQLVQKLIDARLVAVHERVQAHHICFFGV